jgi:hypothetical protein
MFIYNVYILKDDTITQASILINDQDTSFKWTYGLRIFNTWLINKNQELIKNKLPNDLLKLKNEELNNLLAEFVHVVRKPNGESYAPESIYYLCLGKFFFFICLSVF